MSLFRRRDARGIDPNNPAVRAFLDHVASRPEVQAANVATQQMVAGLRDMTAERLPVLEYAVAIALDDLARWARTLPADFGVKMPDGLPAFYIDAFRRAVVAAMDERNEMAAPHGLFSTPNIEVFRAWALKGCRALGDPARVGWLEHNLTEIGFDAQAALAEEGPALTAGFMTVWGVVLAASGDPRSTEEGAAGAEEVLHRIIEATTPDSHSQP